MNIPQASEAHNHHKCHILYLVDLRDSVVHRIVVRLSIGEDPVTTAQIIDVSRAAITLTCCLIYCLFPSSSCLWAIGVNYHQK